MQPDRRCQEGSRVRRSRGSTRSLPQDAIQRKFSLTVVPLYTPRPSFLYTVHLPQVVADSSYSRTLSCRAQNRLQAQYSGPRLSFWAVTYPGKPAFLECPSSQSRMRKRQTDACSSDRASCTGSTLAVVAAHPHQLCIPTSPRQLEGWCRVLSGICTDRICEHIIDQTFLSLLPQHRSLESIHHNT